MREPPGESLRFKAVLPWIGLVLLLSILPYLTAWISTPPGKQFVGALVNPDDFPTYLSAMRQGAAGSWIFNFTFSPEPWQPRIMMMPYLLLGKAAGFLGGNFTVWYHAARLLFAFFTLSMMLVWVRTIFPGHRRPQLTGWFLIVFGAGIGWIAAMAAGQRASTFAPDLFGPEWTPFMALLHTPHFALGLGLELLLFSCVIRMIQTKLWRWVVWSGVAAVALGLTYVYHIPVVGLVVGLTLLSLAWQRRRKFSRQMPWRLWVMGALILLPLTLLLVYYTADANQDPYFARYAQVDHVISPPRWFALFFGLGIVGLLALMGIRPWFRLGFSWLVPIWTGANLLLLYLPWIQFSGRFALGLFVPIATIAALGLEEIVLPWLSQRPFYRSFSRLTPTPYASLRRVFLFLVVPSTFILPFWLSRGALQDSNYPTYLPEAEIEAMIWLGQQVEEGEIVLSSYPTGNYFPAVMAGKVFAGQLDFTTDLEAKLSAVTQFWQADSEDAWRQQLLDEWGIDYVYQGRFERALMEEEVAVPGVIVYDRGGVIIYNVGEE